jgi:hypothetical protein
MAGRQHGTGKPKQSPDHAGTADPEQFQRFLEKAKELGLDPTNETDLHRFDDVLRRVAKLPNRQDQPMRGEGPRGRRKAPKPE